MNLLEAAIMGAAYTIVFLYFIGEKIIKVDFSGLLKRNWKSTKCKKMLALVDKSCYCMIKRYRRYDKKCNNNP